MESAVKTPCLPRRRIILLAAALISAAVAAALAGLVFVALKRPLEAGGTRKTEVDIPRGASTAEIAALLEAKGLVRHRLVMLVLARMSGADGRLRAGRYELSPAMTPEQILVELQKGGRPPAITFTIPEGYTVEDVIGLLVRRGIAPENELRRAFGNPALVARWLPPEGSPERAAVRFATEGYLFPDTYRIDPGTTAEKISAMLVRRFERAFPEEFRRRAEELGLSVHQVVTLASIVEREARVPQERPLIAGVYWNRLRRGMRLDADPTVRYALRKYREPLLYADLEVDSPFNTYRHTGLPPGPIASPGEASLRAALYPADTPYLYFVSRGDGTHVFAKTLQEHNRNVARMTGR